MIRSFLASRYISPAGPDDAARLEALKRRAWRDEGVLMVRVDDPALTWPERELVRNLGRRMFEGSR